MKCPYCIACSPYMCALHAQLTMTVIPFQEGKVLTPRPREEKMSTKLNAYTAYLDDLVDSGEIIVRLPDDGFKVYSLFVRLDHLQKQYEKLNTIINEAKAAVKECPELNNKVPRYFQAF